MHAPPIPRRPTAHRTGDGARIIRVRPGSAVPGLHDALIARGFIPEDAESIMFGEAELLAQHVDEPDGVEIRRATTEDEVLSAGRMQGRIFDDADWRRRVDEVVERMHADESVEFWIAVADGAVVSTGRLEPVAGTEFAGLRGRSHGSGLAGAGDLPRAHGAAGECDDPAWNPLSAVGLDGVLTSDPEAVRSGQDLDHDPYVWAPA